MANKKINQLVSKTSILSTDLFGIGDATTGQLYKKTIAELQAAIGGAVISVNGLVGTVVLDTDDIQELPSPTNKWFTDARARGAISLTVTGSSGASTYNSGTGILNVPTYTLAGLGGISLSSLSGGTGISYNSTTGVISYSGTIYTDSGIRALISGTSPITYNSTTGAIGITQATTSTNGYLSSTDWNTFNGKQSALTNPVTGTGTIGYHAKWTSSSEIGNSLIYDNGSNAIGIAVTTKAWDSTFTALQLGQSGAIWANTTGYGIQLGGNAFWDGSNYKYIVSDFATRYIQSNGIHNWFTSSSGTAGNTITFSEKMRIAETGHVLIGRSTLTGGTGSLEVEQIASGGYTLVLNSSGANESSVYFRSVGSTTRGTIVSNIALAFDVNDAERMRITSGGNILMGTSSNNGERLYISGNVRATGTITANSDLTLKKNLLKIKNALEKVEQINGYTYEFKEDDSKRHAGVIAQEIQTVLPEIVNTGNDGLMGVEYGNISALLIEAIKEQQTQIKELKALLNK